MNLLERKFGEIRNYLDTVSNISVCRKETLEYRNFESSLHVPHTYDDYYVWGIGIGKDFFPDSLNPDESSFQSCMEVIISKEPREYT